MAIADAQKRLTDALTKRDALVAEERATVAAAVAQAKAEVAVQTARIDQVKRQLEADIIKPAQANCEAAEADAKAAAAPVVEDGRARAEALKALAESWRQAGDNARNVFLLQKLNGVIDTFTNTVADRRISNVTMIDGQAPDLGDGGSLPVRAVSTLEQVKRIFGIDLLALAQQKAAPQPPPLP